MFNAGKILASLEKQVSDSFEYYTTFKTPVYLPSSVIFRHQKVGNNFDFDIVDKHQEKPHVKGSILNL